MSHTPTGCARGGPSTVARLELWGVIEVGSGETVAATHTWATAVICIWEITVLGSVGRPPGGPAGAGCAIALLA